MIMQSVVFARVKPIHMGGMQLSGSKYSIYSFNTVQIFIFSIYSQADRLLYIQIVNLQISQILK